jgi:hypothetical protein
VVRLDGTETIRKVARSICRIVVEHHGNATDEYTIMHEANARVFGRGVPPVPPYRRFTDGRARIVRKAWALARSVGFDDSRL